jgi:hypothetical protein
MSVPAFDPALLERMAEQLYRRADSVRIGAAIVGVAFGVLVGAVPFTQLGRDLPVPSAFGVATTLAGGLLGGLIGYTVGEGRAFRIRFQAQLVLYQLQLERNTAAAGRASAADPASATRAAVAGDAAQAPSAPAWPRAAAR